MPGIAVHLHHAAAVLAAWRRDGRRRPPFDVSDPHAARGFLHGALAPDMGLYPGSALFLSDLAHLHRSADLCRALIGEATTDRMRAWAWGWLTHVLVDGGLHPPVNADARALLRAEANVPLGIHAFEEAHLRVELGLDVVYMPGTAALGRAAGRPWLRRPEAELTAAVLRQLYGLRIPPRLILRAHRAMTRWVRPLLFLQRLMWAWSVREGGPRQATTRARPAPRRAPGLLRVLLAPATPTPRLAGLVAAHLRGFPALVSDHAAAGLSTIHNRDLDTGEPVPSGSWASIGMRSAGAAVVVARPA